GWMPEKQGTINSPISRDLLRRERMTTRRQTGRKAVTHWKVLKTLDGKYGKFSFLEIKIETGRTHQIRVHLASVGHPVAGDVLYGAPRVLRGYGGTAQETASLDRHFLHSSGLQFEHPITHKPVELEQPLPEKLEHFLREVSK